MRVAQRPPWYRIPWIWMAVLLSLLMLGLGWVAGQADTPAATAATTQEQGTVSSDSHAAMSIELAKLKEEVSTCRTLTLALVNVVDKQQHEWREHRGAHKRGPHGSGKITMEQVQRIWQITIGAGDALDPLVVSAAKQWRLHCLKT